MSSERARYYGPPPRRLVEGAVRYKIHPHRFLPRRFRPEALGERHWWAILVFQTKDALNDYGNWRGGGEDRGFAGMVISMHSLIVRAGRPDRPRSKLGEVLFWKERGGASVVSHEFSGWPAWRGSSPSGTGR